MTYNNNKMEYLRKATVLKLKELGYLCDDMKYSSYCFNNYNYSNGIITNEVDVLVNNDYTIECFIIERDNFYEIHSRIITKYDELIEYDIHFSINKETLNDTIPRETASDMFR